MVSSAERRVVTSAIAIGTMKIPIPVICMSKRGPKNSSRNPFMTIAPTPKVTTRNGMKILVRTGQRSELTMLVTRTNRNASLKLLSSAPRFRKLIM